MKRPLARLIEERWKRQLPPDLERFADLCQEVYEEAEGGRSGRPSASVASLEEPEWWQFFVERAVRNDLGEFASLMRGMLGLSEPLARGAAGDFVREVIAAAALPETGAYLIFSVPAEEGYELFTVWDGDAAHAGNMEDLEFEELSARFEHRVPRRYFALVLAAYTAGREARECGEHARWHSVEHLAFTLCDMIPPRPWITYDLKFGVLTDEITLKIPTPAVTPEQVRALYERARQSLASIHAQVYPEEPRMLPKAVSRERMELVRFVEKDSGSGPYDWEELLRQWRKQGGRYATQAAMKAAFYQSVNPVRTVGGAPGTRTAAGKKGR